MNKLFDPTIELDAISIPDVELGTDKDTKNSDKNPRYSKYLGENQPLVVINGVGFLNDDLVYMEISNRGFLPTINLVIKGLSGLFLSRAYPKDGDLINIYIKTGDKKYKPIRMDFIILNMDGVTSKDNLGETSRFTIFGVINIPHMDTDRIRSFSNKDSLEVTKEIVKSLKLGYWTNHVNRQDKMTWIQPSVHDLAFLTQDVCLHTYDSQNTIFNHFVDFNYFFNSIEIQKELEKPIDEEYNMKWLLSSDHWSDDKKEKSEVKLPRLFSNSEKTNGTNFHIKGYTVISNAGDIKSNHGYRSVIQYYNLDEKKQIQYYLETLTSDKKDHVAMKGRLEDDHTKYLKAKKMGYINENVHKNYYLAEIQNNINNLEFEKFTLVIDLDGYNLDITKMESIPVHIFTGKSNNVIRQMDDKKEDGTYYSDFLSGNYLIRHFSFIHSGGKQYTKAYVSRRETPILNK